LRTWQLHDHETLIATEAVRPHRLGCEDIRRPVAKRQERDLATEQILGRSHSRHPIASASLTKFDRLSKLYNTLDRFVMAGGEEDLQ
jgi:hypothetical protein